MTDLISRKHALRVAKEVEDGNVPVAIQGEWIYGTDPLTGEKDCKAWTCSLCGGKYPWQPNYCPNCGARMTPYKGGDDE